MWRHITSASGSRAKWFGLAASLAMVLAACQAGTPRVVVPPVSVEPQASTAGSAAAQASKPAAPQTFTAKLQFNPPRAKVGDTVAVAGSGYPANADVELVWYTQNGRYELENGTEFVGERFDETSNVISTVHSNASGEIATKLQVPSDFGGPHDVRGRVQGKELSQASVTIEPTFSLTPTDGPVGTPIELKITGVDWQTNVNTWHVLYDNRYVGLITAVTTKGVAVARFRAAGPVGDRAISVWHNSWFSTPYLNFQQGPYKDTPVSAFTFHVTSDPGPAAPSMDDFTAKDNPWPIKDAGSGTLTLSTDRGPVGKALTIKGSNLPANSTLALRWWTMVGNRVSASGFSEQARSLGDVQIGADGTFTKELTIPNDLGGQHRIDVANGDKVVAAAGVVIEPSLVSFSPTKLKAGEQIKIHLQGVGWTTYDNTYTVDYDNSYVGYVCGFNSNGDVEFTLTATGGPGTHLIDFYPTIYKGKDALPRLYSIPQLTYAEDHPARKTPAIHMAVEIQQ